MNKVKNTYWDFDEKGGMAFKTNNEILRKKHRFQNKITLKSIGLTSAIIACSIIDIFVIYQLFTPLINGNMLFRIIASSALFTGFDIAPVIFGAMVRKKDFGYAINKKVCAAAVVAFTIAILVNLDLRIHSQGSSVDTASAENIMETSVEDEETTTTENPMDGAMARAFSFFPIITSIVSYLASYYMANPLLKELQLKEIELNKIESDMIYSKAALKEYEGIQTLEDLINRDKELLEEAIRNTYITGKLYTDHARNFMLELIETTASGISYISEHPQEEYDALMGSNHNLLTNNQTEYST